MNIEVPRFVTGASAQAEWEGRQEIEDSPELEDLRANLSLAEDCARASNWEQVLKLLSEFDGQIVTGISVAEKLRITSLCDEARTHLSEESDTDRQYSLPL